MKKTAFIFFFFCISLAVHAQYYLRGEIKDEHDNLLQNVRILLHSNGYLYYSGNEGAFGIEIPQRTDSVTISAAGFQVVSLRLSSASYQLINLKPLYPAKPAGKPRLMSATKNLKAGDWHGWTIGTETYNSLVENEFVAAEKFPETGFAVNIDKASYSNVRRFLKMESTVPPDAVRIEELLNYFNLDYIAPGPDSDFSVKPWLTPCPWNDSSQLLFIHLCAKKINLDETPPANLVFLVDVSGSMDMPNKLPLLKSAFRMLVNNLRLKDTVSIVVYGSTVGVWLPPTPGDQKQTILKSIEELYPGGATPGEAGIRAAYRLASNQFIRRGNNRVILATDGDFNVGENTEEELEKLIIMHKHMGIYLTCLGVGMGNYKDSKLQVLAERGNGNFAYLDETKEAEKVLMHEFTQTIYAVADDAYMDVHFNPEQVKDYRLIGFDNKLKLLTDSVTEIQGGEVGSGHSLMAIFEIKPKIKSFTTDSMQLAKITLHYKKPNDSLLCAMPFDCDPALTPFANIPPALRFASSVALFGGLLRKSALVKPASWNEVIEIASHSLDPNDTLQKEFITLVEKAKKIYARDKRRRK